MKINKLFFSLFVAILTIGITSCSKDDNEQSIAFDANTIVGTWTITRISETSDGTGNWKFQKGEQLVFNNDGTCKTGMGMENAYKIEDGVVKTYYKESGEPMYIYKLLGKGDNTLDVKVIGTLDESKLSVNIQMKRIK